MWAGYQWVGSVAIALMSISGGARVACAESVRTPFVHNKYEASIGGIFANTLGGGTFTKVGDDYTNGTFVAQRVSDSDDRFWSGRLTGVDVVARYASQNQSFGYIPGASGGGYMKLFDVVGKGYNVTGGAASVDLGAVARLARGGSGKIYSSDPLSNLDGIDHMLTFRILSSDLARESRSGTRYMFFFEDRAKGGDRDYNDLVIDANHVAVVPLPAAVYAGAALLSILGVHRWRRSRENIM